MITADLSELFATPPTAAAQEAKSTAHLYRLKLCELQFSLFIHTTWLSVSQKDPVLRNAIASETRN